MERVLQIIGLFTRAHSRFGFHIYGSLQPSHTAGTLCDILLKFITGSLERIKIVGDSNGTELSLTQKELDIGQGKIIIS